MRLVLAIVSIVVAALMIGFGIAQRTLLMGPDHITAAVTTSSQATVTVIDGATLNSFDRSQTVTARGSDTIFAAYGRTSDVLAWVGDASYNAITYDATSESLVSTVVPGTETDVPDPAGSDLWLSDYTEKNELDFTINVPQDISVIIVSDGVKPAPSSVSVTWLLDNSTPFAGPLVIGGAIVLLIGLAFLLWAVNHVRRARGPRRKQPRLPKVPRKPTYKPVKRGQPQQALTRGRRSAGMIAAPTLLVSALLLTGCTPGVTTLDGANVLSATAVGEDPGDDVSSLQVPAVTEPQAKRIVSRIATTIGQSDKAFDAELAATRLDGPALAMRTASYKVRKLKPEVTAPSPIPSTNVDVTLPQQNDSWPRTVFVVVSGPDAKVSPLALMLIQDDPRSQYKVHYAMDLEPGTVLPDVAAANIGTNRVGPDGNFFVMSPLDAATAYADILDKDAESEFYDDFEADGDTLRAFVGKEWRDKQKKSVPSTAKMTFASAIGPGQVIVLVTNDGGAIVAIDQQDLQTVKPVEAGAAVNAPKEVAALLGKLQSTRGLTATYSNELLLYIPKAATGGKIILLGYSSGLIAAKELK